MECSRPEQPLRSALLSALLLALLLTYALGAVFFFVVWEGVQGMSLAGARPSLPAYGLLFTFGAVSALAVLKWRRWGVYGLAATWAATAVLNALFSQPVPLITYVGALLFVAALAWEIRRVWHLLR